jgi:hypothetical protein
MLVNFICSFEVAQLEANQIEAFIHLNKLKPAYMVAVRIKSLADVVRIRDAAIASSGIGNNAGVVQICEAYILENKH